MAILLVVNIRGGVNLRAAARKTLTQLHLSRRFRATLIPDTKVYRGMLRAIKNHVAWSTVGTEVVETLLKKRGRTVGWRPLTQVELQALGYDSLRAFAEAIAENQVQLTKVKGVKPSFALTPPRGGFKRSTKKMYAQGGVLGKNPDLPKIVESML